MFLPLVISIYDVIFFQLTNIVNPAENENSIVLVKQPFLHYCCLDLKRFYEDFV